ncbi:MAG: hypothetical protein EAZ94_09205, partial [Oscillatoriales cyanobacterium]
MRTEVLTTNLSKIGSIVGNSVLGWMRTEVLTTNLSKIGSPDFMVYNVTNNTFTVMDFYLDYLLDLPGVK